MCVVFDNVRALDRQIIIRALKLDYTLVFRVSNIETFNPKVRIAFRTSDD
ncbi:MAG: hypothetical protein IKD73_07465 [Selenomonadaceae bacterium]|nr:hypothetical protein [Selenomonadaceae bacterium]